jgi:hypothetical protein
MAFQPAQSLGVSWRLGVSARSPPPNRHGRTRRFCPRRFCPRRFWPPTILAPDDFGPRAIKRRRPDSQRQVSLTICRGSTASLIKSGQEVQATASTLPHIPHRTPDHRRVPDISDVRNASIRCRPFGAYARALLLDSIAPSSSCQDFTKLLAPSDCNCADSAVRSMPASLWAVRTVCASPPSRDSAVGVLP